MTSNLDSRIEWPQTIAEEALIGLAGDVVRTIAPNTEADEVAILSQFLVAAGNLLGRTVYFTVEADRHYCNLFLLLVGDSAKGRKGTSFGHIRKLVSEVDPDWKTNCLKTGLSSGEGLIYSLRDAKYGFTPDGELNPLQILDPGVDDKRACVNEPEFASVLKVIRREGNTLSPLLRTAWDWGTLDNSMVKSSPLKATNCHVSIIGHITSTELGKTLNESEIFNGLVNRFLFAVVKRARLLPEGGNLPAGAFDGLVARLKQCLNWCNAHGEIEIPFNEEARTAWHRVYPELSRDRHGVVGAAVSRAEAQVRRIALLYAALDMSVEVRMEHLSAGLAVWEFCEASAQYVFRHTLDHPLAEKLKQIIIGRDGITKTDIHEALGRHESAKEVDSALHCLLERGIVSEEEGPTPRNGGRRAKIYRPLLNAKCERSEDRSVEVYQ